MGLKIQQLEFEFHLQKNEAHRILLLRHSNRFYPCRVIIVHYEKNKIMKALKLTVFAILAFTTAALANVDKAGKKESTEVKANIFSHTNDMVYLQLVNPTNSKVRIVILDQKGETLHSETIKKDLSILKRFDISGLPSGLYSYKVSNEDYTVIRKIEKK